MKQDCVGNQEVLSVNIKHFDRITTRTSNDCVDQLALTSV